MSTVSNQIEELRKYAKKWSEWNGFNAAMPVLPSTNIRLLRSAADTIEALDRPIGKWIEDKYCDRHYICSNCGESSGTQFDGIQLIPLKTKFCPSCGAKMNNNDNKQLWVKNYG